MDWLNYHHLHYFWATAREGGISKASATLRLSQPTLSAQIKRLEAALGVTLFERRGRSLVLTDTGRMVFQYADDIFSAGRELLDAVHGHRPGRTRPLAVGVANAVPKLIVHRLLRPVVRGPEPVRLICREENTDALLAHLATHTLDVVIADTPAPPHVRVKVFNHALGQSGTTFFATAKTATQARRRFPAALADLPLVLPTANTALRRALDQWFEQQSLRPQPIAEFEDPALMKVFAADMGALFPAPAAITKDICKVYGVRPAGTTDAVREHYYAITAERRLTHPGVVAITSAARDELFR